MKRKWVMKVGDLEDIDLMRFAFNSANGNSAPLSVFAAAEKNLTQQIDTLFTTTYGHYAELYKANIGTKSVDKVLFKQLAVLGFGWVRVKGILLTDCAISSLNYNTDGDEILYSMTIKFRGIREV